MEVPTAPWDAEGPEFFARKMEVPTAPWDAEGPEFFARKMEVPTGIEPVYAVLQTAA